MKISYCIEILDKITKTVTLSDEQLAAVNYLKILLHSTFIKRSYRKSPVFPMKVKISDLIRVRNEPFTSKIIYTLQLNNGPISFGQFVKLFHDKARVNGALQSLLRTGMIIRSDYATYSLTEKGGNRVV